MLTRRALLASTSLAAADWPQWRGPARDGRTTEPNLLCKWPATGPKQLWRAEGLGEGYSSFAIANGKLYTQGQKDNAQWVLCFDALTGKQVWKVKAGSYYPQDRGPGPRGTPTVDGDTVYSLSADGTLVSLAAATGKQNWTINILDKFGGRNIHWGLSESPLVDGARLIVQPGGPDHAVVALEKTTGKPLWHAGSDPAGYSSAIAFDFGGLRNIVAFTARGAVGFNAANGYQLWRYNKVSNRTANIATPLFHDGHVFLSSDYGTGCALLKLGKTAEGVSATEVYFNQDMKNHYCSSVLLERHVYGFSSGILTSMELMSGAVAWKDRSVGKGQILLANGMLVLQGENGVIALAEATPAAYKEVSSFTFGRGDYPLWTQPVIANGRMYVRDQDKLVCFSVAAA
jgi:outer membrane protein assembly factor BamB